MRINITSVLVDDQEKALKFYTEVFGFVEKTDVPAGEYRWLTVVPPEDPDGTELLNKVQGFDVRSAALKPCLLYARPNFASTWPGFDRLARPTRL